MTTTEDKRIEMMEKLVEKMKARIAASKDPKRTALYTKQLDRIKKQIAIERKRAATKTSPAKAMKNSADADSIKIETLKRIKETQLRART